MPQAFAFSWGRRFSLPLVGSMTWQAKGPAPQGADAKSLGH